MLARRQPPHHDAKLFIGDVAGRLANRVQLSTDGHKPYLTAVDQHFGDEIDYGVIVKIYGSDKEDGRKVSQLVWRGVHRHPQDHGQGQP